MPQSEQSGLIVHFEDGRVVRFPADMSEDAVVQACKRIAMPLPEPTPPRPLTGAPTDFGGAVLPNPKGVGVQADTDPPPTPPTSVDMNNLPTFKGDSTMDTSNPVASQLVPPEVPPDQREQ
jgi:hypothetical protein